MSQDPSDTTSLLASKLSADVKAQILTAMGYRRVSNGHRGIARIDRPDWLDVLAKDLRRSPAEFYRPGEKDPAITWCDQYRRVYSKDTIHGVPEDVFKRIPGSGDSDCGFVNIAIKAFANTEAVVMTEGGITAADVAEIQDLMDQFVAKDLEAVYAEMDKDIKQSSTAAPTLERMVELMQECRNAQVEKTGAPAPKPYKNIKVGDKYVHESGKVFTIVGIANDSALRHYETVNVIYQSSGDPAGSLLSMPYSHWYVRVRDGKFLPIPAKGSIWKHINSGKRYYVEAISNLDAEGEKAKDYPPYITYRRETDGTTWTRPLAKWFASYRYVQG